MVPKHSFNFVKLYTTKLSYLCVLYVITRNAMLQSKYADHPEFSGTTMTGTTFNAGVFERSTGTLWALSILSISSQVTPFKRIVVNFLTIQL